MGLHIGLFNISGFPIFQLGERRLFHSRSAAHENLLAVPWMSLTSFINDAKNGVNLYLLPMLIKRYVENEPGSQGLFLSHINQQIPWNEMSVFEKYQSYDKQGVCLSLNLTTFIAFPLPSMETGTKFHVFQSDLAPKRTW